MRPVKNTGMKHFGIRGSLENYIYRNIVPQYAAFDPAHREDHRASGKSEPRSIYGKIVAEADRLIDCDTIIRRTLQYGLSKYPELTQSGQISRALEHIYDKYGYPLSKHINTALQADMVYILMKPLEWIFILILYLCDEKPENRIAMQYTGNKICQQGPSL